jgi:hypothetical protein
MPLTSYIIQQNQTPPVISTTLLTDANIFPSNYKLTIIPTDDEIIKASEFVLDNADLNKTGEVNSFTLSPSLFQYSIRNTNVILSDYIYKVVFQDSTNLKNNSTWQAREDNQVFVWLYFGKSLTIPITSEDLKAGLIPNISRTITPVITAQSVQATLDNVGEERKPVIKSINF